MEWFENHDSDVYKKFKPNAKRIWGGCSRPHVYKITKADEEISALIASGFECICENDGLKFFRKFK